MLEGFRALPTNVQIGFVVVGVSGAATAIGGRIILKQNEEIEGRYKRLALVTQELHRIASYEAALINKHIDGKHLDDFDRMAIDDMEASLAVAIEEYHKVVDPEKKS